MRTNLFTRLNTLEADRGSNLVTVHSLDSFYGVPGARPTQMTQSAFKARAVRGLAGFYADQSAAPATYSEFTPLQREHVLGPSEDTTPLIVPPTRTPFDPAKAQSALDREVARLFKAYMANQIKPDAVDVAIHASAASLLKTGLFEDATTKDDLVVRLAQAIERTQQ